jgi:hypothetical protein
MPDETKPTTGITDDSIRVITSAVNDLSETFGRVYQRLNFSGFVSVYGAILVFFPLFFGKLPYFSFTIDEQQLYVAAGTMFVVLGAVGIIIVNTLIYKLQRAKQEVACRMLAIKVAAMGEIQKAALAEIGEATSVELNDQPFKDK